MREARLCCGQVARLVVVVWCLNAGLPVAAWAGCGPTPIDQEKEKARAEVERLETELDRKIAELAAVQRQLVLARQRLARASKEGSSGERLWRQANRALDAKQYRKAALTLEQILKEYPKGLRAVQARFLLEVASMKAVNRLHGAIAATEDEDLRKSLEKEVARWERKGAAAANVKIRLDDRQDADRYRRWLSETAEKRNREDPYGAGKSWFEVGEYAKALKAYERVRQSKDPLWRVTALGGMASCRAALGQLPQLRQTLLEIRMEMKSLDASARQTWEKWLKEVVDALEGHSPAAPSAPPVPIGATPAS
jgi:tetratricopeptide (TPR) repeat protein